MGNRDDNYQKARSYRETVIRAITHHRDRELPLAEWDLKRMYGYIDAQFRATTREKVRELLDESSYLEGTAVELELVSRILDHAGLPEEAGSVSERVRLLVIAHEQEIAALRGVSKSREEAQAHAS